MNISPTLKINPQNGLKENRRRSNFEYQISKERILSNLKKPVKQLLDTIFFLFSRS